MKWNKRSNGSSNEKTKKESKKSSSSREQEGVGPRSNYKQAVTSQSKADAAAAADAEAVSDGAVLTPVTRSGLVAAHAQHRGERQSVSALHPSVSEGVSMSECE